MFKNRRISILSMAIGIILLCGFLPFDTYMYMDSIKGLHNIAMAEEEDTTKPIVDYAYVENGILKLSISDDEELARKPIIYKIDKESNSYEIDIRDYTNLYDGRKLIGRVYEIEVDIPTTIYIIVKDMAGNENEYKFVIKEDNAHLTSDVPGSVLEQLDDNRQSIVNRFEGLDNIFELEYGKLANAFSLYDEVIKEHYSKYSKDDIKFKASGLSLSKDGNIKLNKYGVFKITMTHSKDKTFEESGYILIRPDWKNTNDRKAPLNVSPYIIYKNNFKIEDYLIYDGEGSNSKGKIDTTYMLVYNEDTGELFNMKDKINLELNKPYNLSILNFENDSQQDFYIMSQEKIKSSNKNFKDVDRDHWASKDIGFLVSKGLLSGYPDGSFNPSGYITIKEFMTILSRHIATNYKKNNPVGKPIVGNVTPPVETDAWGYMESKSILDRIKPKELSKFDYVDIDRPINREEVAFLIDKVLEFGIPYNSNQNKPIVDIAMSTYPTEVSNLVNQGLISGYPDNTFKPKNYITRAEIAAIFARMK